MKMGVRALLEKFIDVCKEEKKKTKSGTMQMEIIDMMLMSLDMRINPKPTKDVEIKPDRKMIEIFKDYGFDEDEANVYCYLIQYGKPVKLGSCYRPLKMERDKIYRVVERLERKGFVADDFTLVSGSNRLLENSEDGYVKKFFALSPEVAVNEHYDRIVLDAEQRRKLIENNLSYINSLNKIIVGKREVMN